ncbi:hypothetical protein KGD82_17805 [Nocardiopsis eucommiae]|uniref:Uncharacterized protein n=1 Tax=Nocardiopsis eucommiae TaxID=2831970 RepID=A0A975L7F6_9ACTN|nr:hypothetical protein KGD82_17805 [Nocardiopsis eucommiae]
MKQAPAPPRRPRIAVVGSVDASREYEPPLSATDQVRAACHDLGRELALAGYDLVVFADDEHYVETLVARGYAAASAPDSRIIAHPPRHQDYAPVLPEGSRVRVTTIRDTGAEWEVPYYRTLFEVDGIVLAGGGRSTRVTGVVALAHGVPVVPLAVFGGAARQVWVYLDGAGEHVDREDVRALGESWSTGSARRMAEVLRRQMERRAERRRREERNRRWGRWRESAGLVSAILLLLAALASIVLAGGPGPADPASLSLLLAGPMCAAVSGALIRDSFGRTPSALRASARGLGAGAVSVLLYVAAQLLTVPELLVELDARRLLFFVVPVGFTAGFTFDLVLERLRSPGGPQVAPPPSLGTRN